MAKRIVILEHGGGELANQLWNYASIYAYTLEKGLALSNPSFYEYGSKFRMPRNKIIDTLLFRPFKNYRGRRGDLKPRTFRLAYKLCAKAIQAGRSGNVVSSVNSENKAYYLSPSRESEGNLKALEESDKNVYFIGWLFRNPRGLERYRKEIIEYFRPALEIEEHAESIIKGLRGKYEKVIGIHIRQGDYKDFKGGKYFIPQERVREILSEYARENILDAGKTAFIVASDGPVDESLFKNLNVHFSKEDAVTDLFLLSRTDAILGSDSSFGDFAAWYGNIPHIVFKKEPIDWAYYSDKKAFFENKYSTLVHY